MRPLFVMDADWPSGGGGAPSGAAGGVLSGSYPDPGLAVDVALPGNPTTTTQAANNSSTRVATTAFVIGQVSSVIPPMDTLTGDVGNTTRFARSNHAHPSDTTKADVADVSYVEFNTDITVSATSAAAADLVVTAGAFTANGTDKYDIEFFVTAAQVGSSSTSALIFVVWLDGAVLAVPRIAQLNNVAAAALIAPVGKCGCRVTPASGSRTYAIRAYRVTNNGVVLGSNSGTSMPGYIKIRKAA